MKIKTLNKFKNFGIELGEVIQYSIAELKPYESNKKFLNSNFLSKHVVNIPNEYKIKKKVFETIMIKFTVLIVLICSMEY
jgi:hypothetical protein